MPVFKPDEYLSRIRSGEVAPVVLLHREEQLLSDECVDALLVTSVDEGMREFNTDVLDGSKVTVQDVLARAMSYPMMSERRIVVVNAFERLVGSEKAQELFLGYLQN